MSAQSTGRKSSGDKDSADPTLARLQSLRQKRVARFFLVIVLVFLAFWLARDFLAPIGWAVVVAIATWPLYTRFASRFRHRKRLAPLLFTLMVGIILLLPIFLTINEITQDSDTMRSGSETCMKMDLPCRLGSPTFHSQVKRQLAGGKPTSAIPIP